MKKVLKWIKEHVRPHFKWYSQKGKEIDLKKDSLKDVADKTGDQSEVGIKFKFKF